MRKKNLLLIVIIAVIVLAGGASAFSFLIRSGGDGHKKEAVQENVIISLEPFIVNLYDPQKLRYLKMSLQLELAKTPEAEYAKTRIPQIKDAVIMLLTSKSAEALQSPEGKLIFKDEVTLAAGQIVGENIVKNVYITDFMMQ